jgi:hypothetical protein
MGFILHAAVIAAYPSLQDAKLGGRWLADRTEADAKLAWFLESLPEDWRRLVVGPVEALINGDAWLVFLPDGSKEGWDLSKEGMEYRIRFQELFGGLIVRWGDENPTVSREPESAEYGLA